LIYFLDFYERDVNFLSVLLINWAGVLYACKGAHTLFTSQREREREREREKEGGGESVRKREGESV